MPSLLPASILAHLTPDCSFVSPLPPFPPPLSLLSSQGSGTDSGRGWYKHKKWMPIGSPKKFGGVECNDEGNVIEMILPSMNIVGVIPCNTFQFLPHLLKVGVCIVCDVCVYECTVDVPWMRFMSYGGGGVLENGGGIPPSTGVQQQV